MLIPNASQNDKWWDTQEDFGLAALDLLPEEGVLMSQVVQVEAEVDELISAAGVL